MIELDNVKKHFQQGEVIVEALRGITLSIDKGEFTAIVGPSGSGKTTLLNLIGALDFPTEGKIIFDGKDLSQLKKKELSNFRLYNIGFVFQAYNLIPVLTALENIEYILLLQGIVKQERYSRAMELLREMGIEDLAHRFPREMSGGQQQRVAVARALIAEPKVVLADEPTANLDSHTAEHLLDIMYEMCIKKHITFIFSTHDDKVMKKAKRIVHIRDGLIETQKSSKKKRSSKK